jgi:antitoxin PrlF
MRRQSNNEDPVARRMIVEPSPAADLKRRSKVISCERRSEGRMTTTVTTKGQVTIPKPVRDLLGIGPGSKVDFHRAADGSVIITPADPKRPPGRFDRLRGHAGAGFDTDTIMALIRGET